MLEALEAPKKEPSLTYRAGSYLLEGEIARGGFGAVFRARHAETGRAAAVKVLHVGRSGDTTAITRFEREAEVVLALGHPHVVEIFEHGRLDDGRPYFAMELLEGETLADHLAARGRMRVDEALAVLDPLAAALDAAHARGIVHRDLKPTNVFLAGDRPRGRVVLLDFGMAKLRDGRLAPLTGASDVLGTVLYMAPEQALGSTVDARADIYALGALAYAMLTGLPPFGEHGGQALRQLRLRARPAAPSTLAPVDPALDAPILRALDRDPDGRMMTARDLVAALRAAAHPSIAPALPAGTTVRPAFAVHADVRVDAAALADHDDSVLADMEAALPTVSAELSPLGMVAVIETTTTLLMVHVGEDDAEKRRAAIDAAARAYASFAARVGSNAVGVGIAVHAGEIVLSAEGTLVEAGLLDLRAWVPAAPVGVVASREALVGLSDHGEEVPGVQGFSWINRPSPPPGAAGSDP